MTDNKEDWGERSQQFTSVFDKKDRSYLQKVLIAKLDRMKPHAIQAIILGSLFALTIVTHLIIR